MRTARAREPLSLEVRVDLSSEVREDLSSEVRVEDRVDLSSEVREDLSSEDRVSPEEARHILISLSLDSVTSRANMVSPCELKETSVLSSLFHPCQYKQMFYVNKPLLIL